MKRMISLLLVMALLLCGCVSNGEPTSEPTNPTESSPVPTVPSTEPAEPSVEPTAPTTEPTQPPTEPTEPAPSISAEDAILVAARDARVTVYQAKCVYVRRYFGEIYSPYYHVTLDVGDYVYEADVKPFFSTPFDPSADGRASNICCTPKKLTGYPDHYTLPSVELSQEEFENRYTILKPAGTDTIPEGTKTIKVWVYLKGQVHTELDGLKICTTDGKPMFHYKGKVYIWENDHEFTQIGPCKIEQGCVLVYTLYDGSYEFTLDFEHDLWEVGYQIKGDRLYSAGFNSSAGTPLRIEISNYNQSQVQCFLISNGGEVKIEPDYVH